MTPIIVVSYLFRSLGSVVGLSVGSTLFQNTLRKYLHERLLGQDVDEARVLHILSSPLLKCSRMLVLQIVHRVRESLNYVDQLEPSVRAIVRTSYEEALQATFWFAVVLSVLALISSFFIKEKPLLHPGRD